MKRRIFGGIAEHISDNKKHYVLVLAAMLIGLTLGSVSAVSLEGERAEGLSGFTDSFISSYNLQPVNKTRVFTAALWGNLRLAFYLWISGMWIGLIPFAVFHMGVKGYKIGFTAAFLIYVYKGRGILFAIMSLMPQILVLMPVFTVYTVFNMKYALSVRRLRMRKVSDSVRRDMYIRNFLCAMGVVAAVMLCSVFDAFVVPPILKPICSYLTA